MAINKVLVVDDSATDRKNMEEILTKGGYRVTLADSGLDALNKCKADKPDVIFLDVVMDDKNGFQTCRELKKNGETKGIPVFLVSSKAQKVDHLYASQVGAEELIPKPADEATILGKLRAL